MTYEEREFIRRLCSGDKDWKPKQPDTRDKMVKSTTGVWKEGGNLTTSC